MVLTETEYNYRGRCAGFLGSLCETNINDCRSGPCQAGAQCVDWIDDFYCRCPPETFGKTCGTVVMATCCRSFSHARILRKRLRNHSPDCSVFFFTFIFIFIKRIIACTHQFHTFKPRSSPQWLRQLRQMMWTRVPWLVAREFVSLTGSHV